MTSTGGVGGSGGSGVSSSSDLGLSEEEEERKKSQVNDGFGNEERFDEEGREERKTRLTLRRTCGCGTPLRACGHVQ